MGSKRYVKSIAELEAWVLNAEPSLYLNSETSTVLPKTLDILREVPVSLSSLPKVIRLQGSVKAPRVLVEGPVTWGELSVELALAGLSLPSAPTEPSSAVLSGLATACSGESTFGQGTLRDKVVSIEYLDYQGRTNQLLSSETTKIDRIKSIFGYQSDFGKYKNFKNAPFPRLEKDTDLMIGFEGQLGVITSAIFEPISLVDQVNILIPSGNWREDSEKLIWWHTRLQEWINKHKGAILAFEFFDQRCIENLLKDGNLKAEDYIALSVNKRMLGELSSFLESSIKPVDLKWVISLDCNHWKKIRNKIPREINEFLSKYSLTKRSTDIQCLAADLSAFIDIYKELSHKYDTYLFGHLGDCHLHLNFIAENSEASMAEIDLELSELYAKLAESFICSPFAEHGIGIFKQKYIKGFWGKNQFKVFNQLKQLYDPCNIFFPSGFMSIEKDRSEVEGPDN